MSNHYQLRGKDLHAPSSETIEQHTGSTISKLSVVSLDGMGAVYPKIKLSNPSFSSNFGITQEDIQNNKVGQITCLGFMFEVDTSPWSISTILYSSSTGSLQTTVNGAPIALVVKQDATFGVLYVTSDLENLATINSFWQLDGNSGTDPITHFLGTTDNQPLVLRTNNVPVAKITETGRFGIGEQNPDELVHAKAHSGFDGTGNRLTTYALTTSDTNWNLAYSYTLPLKSVIQISSTAIGYNTTTKTRASFRKTASLWRESSIAVLAGPVQADYTYRDISGPGYNMRIKTLSNQVIVEIQAHSSELTKWTGSVTFDITVDS